MEFVRAVMLVSLATSCGGPQGEADASGEVGEATSDSESASSSASQCDPCGPSRECDGVCDEGCDGEPPCGVGFACLEDHCEPVDLAPQCEEQIGTTFLYSVDLPDGVAADEIGTADFDGDGRADVIAELEAGVWLALGASPAAAIDLGAVAFPGRVDRQLADIDGDGHVDILAHREATSVPLFGDGTGTFDAGPAVDLGRHPLSVAALGDLDADGNAEIIAFVDIPQPEEGGAGHFMSMFAGPDGQGGGVGTYAPAAGFAIASGVIGAHGHPSAIWTTIDGYALVITPADASGFPAGGMRLPTHHADIGDRRLGEGVGGELVVMSTTDRGTVLTFLGEGNDGRVEVSGRTELPVVLHTIDAVDLDADLDDDLVLAGTSVVLLRAREHEVGCFAMLEDSGASDVAVADLDGDGCVELVLARPPGFEVHAFDPPLEACG
ncbi:MAG: VCBS repeat-containing protein [Deltaproteobacteria bacterium]|nr:VCBS repeat-containing protein [Nannocystaceae bacterium]